MMPGGDIDKEQDVMRHQAPDRADFDAQKVGYGQAFPVSFQKRRPPGVLIALRSRFDPVLYQNVGSS
jgi:hypothetical protein